MADPPIDPAVVLEHIQDGILIVDLDGRVVWANEVFKEMIGRTGEDLTGHRCCELKVGAFCDDLCPIRTGTGAGCAVGAHFNVQVGSESGQGRPGAYCFVTTPVYDRNGRLVGIMENFRGMDRVRDVIMQLEEVNEAISAEREKTEQLIDSMADGVFSVDDELRIRRFSRSLEAMLGITAEQAIGRPCSEVLRGTLCETDCPLVWAREHGSPVTGCHEELFSVGHGRSIPVSISRPSTATEPA